MLNFEIQTLRYCDKILIRCKKHNNFQLKQANQDLNSDLLVQNKKRENSEKELIKFEERYKADQKLNNDQMAKILKEMQDLEAKNKETVDKMKTKNITDSKSYQVLIGYKL